jgi:hypothetical protein
VTRSPRIHNRFPRSRAALSAGHLPTGRRTCSPEGHQCGAIARKFVHASSPSTARKARGSRRKSAEVASARLINVSDQGTTPDQVKFRWERERERFVDRIASTENVRLQNDTAVASISQATTRASGNATLRNLRTLPWPQGKSRIVRTALVREIFSVLSTQRTADKPTARYCRAVTAEAASNCLWHIHLAPDFSRGHPTTSCRCGRQGRLPTGRDDLCHCQPTRVPGGRGNGTKEIKGPRKKTAVASGLICESLRQGKDSRRRSH